jgi:UDP-2,4-diacetamido-2,4,6-trideoxy-beta-L-altropyranose hydrolase
VTAGARPSALIRADASSVIGTGHFVRSFALARELNRRGWVVSFAARDLPEALRRELERAGHRLVTIPGDVPMVDEPRYLADVTPDPFRLLVSDHYDVDAEWQRRASRMAGTLAAVDDLARGEQAVDVLVNQNLGFATTDYDGLVPRRSHLLIGPQYAMLRPEFRLARATGIRVRDRVRRVLVFLSGGDSHNVTRTVVESLTATDATIDVIIGGAFAHAQSLRNLASQHPRLTVHENTQDMARLMLLADLAVGAPSSASWDRCCLGLPAITKPESRRPWP